LRSPRNWDTTRFWLRHHTSSLAGCYVTRGDTNVISNFGDAVWKSVYVVDCVDFSYVFAIVCNKSQKSSEKRSTAPTNAGSLT
ncbi:hypothetical protein DPEC_G00205620, partial [Dallia pectoralis]